MLIKSLKSGNHYQFITLFVVCATGRSCLLFNNKQTDILKMKIKSK